MAATNERPKPQQQQSSYKQQQENRKAMALQVNPPRLPYPIEEAKQYDCTPGMWRALIDSTWPGAKTVDGVLLALSWCKWRKLDPIKKPCHIVAIWSSALGREVESVWPSIAEVRTTAHRTGQYVGCDETLFGPTLTTLFEGDVEEWRDGNKSEIHKKVTLKHPEWAQVTVYRFVFGEPRKFVGPKVYFLAAYGCIGKTDLPNEKWSEPGAQMLDKCAEAAALRKAFPEELGDGLVAEEMEGRKFMDFGGGMSVAQPEQDAAKQRPQRTDFRDVQTDGNVAEQGTSDQGGGDAPKGHDLVDETGEVLRTIADDNAYCDAVCALFEKATELRHLETITANNLAVLDVLPRPLGRKARDSFDAAKRRLAAKPAGGGAGTVGGKPVNPPDGGGGFPADKTAPAPTGALSVRNARGKIVREQLDPHGFAIEVVKLFEAAEIQIDLEATYRENGDTIRSLPDAIQDSVIEDYGKTLEKFQPSGA